MDPSSTIHESYVVERVKPQELGNIWSKCTDLAKEMAYPSFFCSGDWLHPLATNFRNSENLVVYIAKQGNDIIAVLPLIIKRNALGGNDLYFLGTEYYPDPIGLITTSQFRSKITKYIIKHLFSLPDWDRIFLNSVLEDEADAWNVPKEVTSIEPYKLLPNSIDVLLANFKKKSATTCASW